MCKKSFPTTPFTRRIYREEVARRFAGGRSHYDDCDHNDPQFGDGGKQLPARRGPDGDDDGDPADGSGGADRRGGRRARNQRDRLHGSTYGQKEADRHGYPDLQNVCPDGDHDEGDHPAVPSPEGGLSSALLPRVVTQR